MWLLSSTTKPVQNLSFAGRKFPLSEYKDSTTQKQPRFNQDSTGKQPKNNVKVSTRVKRQDYGKGKKNVKDKRVRLGWGSAKLIFPRPYAREADHLKPAYSAPKIKPLEQFDMIKGCLCWAKSELIEQFDRDSTRIKRGGYGEGKLTEGNFSLSEIARL